MRIAPGSLAAAAILLLLAVAPVATGNPFYQHIAALVVLAAISASAWNVIGGYAGQVSFGHAVYFGTGAYASLLTFDKLGLPPIAGAPLGVLASFVLSVVIGLPSFRLRGHYFSMATIAVAALAQVLVTNWGFVGGAIGLMGPASPRSIADLLFRSALPYYAIFLGVLAVLLACTWLMQRGRTGFYLRALGSGEQAAASLGVPVRRYKLYALLLSGAFTSLAGSLYAVFVGFIDPDSGFGILISVNMVVMSALGGAGTLFGPLVGAIILVPLEEITNAWFGGSGTGTAYVAYGIVIMIIARFAPGGLAQLWQLFAWRRRRAA
ncbi:MAG TPA: branched-chain amino acid ABC transporter permease [Acetobacteraceae bacterium]|nr:branched-chain amino acid ABC transporter permease [Acetobacteraceae bacterium]